MIRKLIIINRRPSWNTITLVISRAGGHLIPGANVGKHERPLMAFRKDEAKPLFWFNEPHAWDSANVGTVEPPNHIRLTSYLRNVRPGVWELVITLNADDLDKAVYPVYVDPTITLQPDAAEGKNSCIRENTATYNYGSCDYMEIGWYGPLGAFYKGIIQFDLSDIPANANIISSILKVTQNPSYCDDPGAGNYIPIQPHRVLREWNEGNKCVSESSDGEVNWNYAKHNQVAWTTAGAEDIGTDIAEQEDPDALESYDCTAYKVYDIDLTASTQTIINGATNNGWLLPRRNDNSGSNQGIRFYTDDASNANYRPKLVIEYTESGGIFIPAKPNIVGGKGINLIGG